MLRKEKKSNRDLAFRGKPQHLMLRKEMKS